MQKSGDWISLSVHPSLGNAIDITYHGTVKRAWCDVVSSHPALPQRVWANVPLRRGQWATLVNLLKQAQLEAFPADEPPSPWSVMDAVTYTLRVRLGDVRHQLVRVRPEPRLARAINQLLDACPVLVGHEVIKQTMRCDDSSPTA